MITRLPSYIVAEIPEPVRTDIQVIRDSFSTPTALLPVEITLLGSSGVGPIPSGTSIQFIQEQIDSLFLNVSPWVVSFSEINSFPNTSIVYLAPSNRQPFDHLHAILRDSLIPHSSLPFPYNPHCTLRSGDTTPGELSRALRHTFPSTSFKINTISVYQFDSASFYFELICQKQFKTEQGAAANL